MAEVERSEITETRTISDGIHEITLIIQEKAYRDTKFEVYPYDGPPKAHFGFRNSTPEIMRAIGHLLKVAATEIDDYERKTKR